MPLLALALAHAAPETTAAKAWSGWRSKEWRTDTVVVDARAVRVVDLARLLLDPGDHYVIAADADVADLRISLKIAGMKRDEALAGSLRSFGLGYVYNGYRMRIARQDQLDSERDCSSCVCTGPSLTPR